MGDGSRIHFWDDVWCVEEPLRVAFPELYCIACIKVAAVAEYIQFQGESVHWEVHFTRLVQDCEL